MLLRRKLMGAVCEPVLPSPPGAPAWPPGAVCEPGPLPIWLVAGVTRADLVGTNLPKG